MIKILDYVKARQANEYHFLTLTQENKTQLGILQKDLLCNFCGIIPNAFIVT